MFVVPLAWKTFVGMALAHHRVAVSSLVRWLFVEKNRLGKPFLNDSHNNRVGHFQNTLVYVCVVQSIQHKANRCKKCGLIRAVQYQMGEVLANPTVGRIRRPWHISIHTAQVAQASFISGRSVFFDWGHESAWWIHWYSTGRENHRANPNKSKNGLPSARGCWFYF